MPLSSALWKNGESDPDAVWHHRSDGCRDEAGGGVWPTEGVLFGAHLGRVIITNGNFTASVYDSASTVGLGWCVPWVEALLMNERHGALAHPTRLRMLAVSRRYVALSPNYFGQTC